MKTCLVTGGAGFIGSHLVEALIAKGHTVSVLDSKPIESAANLQRVRDRINYFEASVCDLEAVRRASRGVDVIFHQTEIGSVSGSIRDPRTTNQLGVDGTLNVLEAARENEVTRVVYGSSASVYGSESRLPRCEDSPLEPISPYGAARLAGENYCVAFTANLGLETVRLRYFNVYGPRQELAGDQVAVLPAFLNAMAAGQRPVIYGDGMQTRDFVRVADVVQANLLAADNPRAAGKAYNIGSGVRTSVLGLLGMINRALDTNLVPIHVRARPGEVRFSQADITSAQRDLGFCPCTDLAEDLRLLAAGLNGGLRGPRFLRLHHAYSAGGPSPD